MQRIGGNEEITDAERGGGFLEEDHAEVVSLCGEPGGFQSPRIFIHPRWEGHAVELAQMSGGGSGVSVCEAAVIQDLP